MQNKTTLIFATSNAHKVKEIREILSDKYQVLGLSDIGFEGDLPETQDTIRGNAIQKASTLFEMKQTSCFAEDTGLEIDALNGEPGVHSARYAGLPRSNERNMEKVLNSMKAVKDRTARFRTVIAFISGGQITTFEGIVEGEILEAPQGSGGFGYDPIFKPSGFDHSFGELPPEIKNKISHRAEATNKLVNHLISFES